MQKEMLIKLLLLCGISNTTINYCTYLGIRIWDVEKVKYRILSEQDGRMEL